MFEGRTHWYRVSLYEYMYRTVRVPVPVVLNSNTVHVQYSVSVHVLCTRTAVSYQYQYGMMISANSIPAYRICAYKYNSYYKYRTAVRL